MAKKRVKGDSSFFKKHSSVNVLLLVSAVLLVWGLVYPFLSSSLTGLVVSEPEGNIITGNLIAGLNPPRPVNVPNTPTMTIDTCRTIPSAASNKTVFLTRSIAISSSASTAGGNGPCILVDASNVIIDGRGFTITRGSSATTSIGVYIEPGRSNVTIRNLTLVGFDTGISAVDNTSFLQKNISVQNVVINSSRSGAVGVAVSLNYTGGFGFRMPVTSTKQISIQRSSIVLNGTRGTGILLSSPLSQLAVANTVFTVGKDGAGILDLSSQDSIFSNNAFTIGEGATGLRLSGANRSRVETNVFSMSASRTKGIDIFSSGTGTQTVVSSNRFIGGGANITGIRVVESPQSRILENTFFFLANSGSRVIELVRVNGSAVAKNNIELNTIFGSQATLILATDSVNAIIANNTLTSAGSDVAGIALTNVRHSAVTGNTVVSSGQRSPAVLLQQAVQYVQVSGNSFNVSGSNSAGIRSLSVPSGRQNIGVTNNIIRSFASLAHGIHFATTSLPVIVLVLRPCSLMVEQALCRFAITPSSIREQMKAVLLLALGAS